MLKYSNKATFCGGLPFPFSLGHKSMRTKGRNNDRNNVHVWPMNRMETALPGNDFGESAQLFPE